MLFFSIIERSVLMALVFHYKDTLEKIRTQRSHQFSDLRSHVVYKFSCAGCNARYIGETRRHLSTRVREHLSRDRNSHIYQHLQQSPACRGLANNNCFSIVDGLVNEYINLPVTHLLCILVQRMQWSTLSQQRLFCHHLTTTNYDVINGTLD